MSKNESRSTSVGGAAGGIEGEALHMFYAGERGGGERGGERQGEKERERGRERGYTVRSPQGLLYYIAMLQ